MNTKALSTPQPADEPSASGFRAVIGRWSGRWSPSIAVFIATVRVDRMDEIERLHDAYSID